MRLFYYDIESQQDKKIGESDPKTRLVQNTEFVYPKKSVKTMYVVEVKEAMESSLLESWPTIIYILLSIIVGHARMSQKTLFWIACCVLIIFK